jgi:hypothetical protein
VYGATQVSLGTTVSDEKRVWKIDTVTAQVWEYVSGPFAPETPEQRDAWALVERPGVFYLLQDSFNV